jgi:peptidoglycan/xylan/chitin deacetylase (PgdA/CDA1 family)
MQRMKERSHRRRTGASLLATVAVFALTQALVSVELPMNPRPSNVATLRTLSFRSSENVRAIEAASGTPASNQALEMVPAGRASISVPIMMYHYIRDNPDPRDVLGANLSVSPAEFRQQMDWLARNGYHPVDLDDLRGYLLGSGTLPSRPVVISLDDGYSDLYTAAYPVLRAHQFKAVAYIVTGFLGRPTNVTPAQVVEMNANGIEIGSHTVSHADLTKASATELQRQLDDSKVTLEAILGHPVLDFCYPSGAVNSTVVHAVQAAGYQSATTTRGGSTVHSAADRFEWTRVRVTGGESMTEFAARLGTSEPSQPTPATSSVLSVVQPLRAPLRQRRALARVPPIVPTWEGLTP